MRICTWSQRNSKRFRLFSFPPHRGVKRTKLVPELRSSGEYDWSLPSRVILSPMGGPQETCGSFILCSECLPSVPSLLQILVPGASSRPQILKGPPRWLQHMHLSLRVHLSANYRLLASAACGVKWAELGCGVAVAVIRGPVDRPIIITSPRPYVRRGANLNNVPSWECGVAVLQWQTSLESSVFLDGAQVGNVV